MTTIKPCPFCGEQLVEKSDHHGKWWGHHNDLGACECSINQLHDQNDIDRWNRRASPWRPMETLPKDLRGRQFLLWDAEACRAVAAERREDMWLDFGGTLWADWVFSKWALIQAPPAEDEKEGGK